VSICPSSGSNGGFGVGLFSIVGSIEGNTFGGNVDTYENGALVSLFSFSGMVSDTTHVVGGTYPAVTVCGAALTAGTFSGRWVPAINGTFGGILTSGSLSAVFSANAPWSVGQIVYEGFNGQSLDFQGGSVKTIGAITSFQATVASNGWISAVGRYDSTTTPQTLTITQSSTGGTGTLTKQ
jgi:hypothetical protein